MSTEHRNQKIKDAERLASGVQQILLNEIRQLREENALLDKALRTAISALLASHELFGHCQKHGGTVCRVCELQRVLRYRHESLLMSPPFQARLKPVLGEPNGKEEPA